MEPRAHVCLSASPLIFPADVSLCPSVHPIFGSSQFWTGALTASSRSFCVCLVSMGLGCVSGRFRSSLFPFLDPPCDATCRAGGRTTAVSNSSERGERPEHVTRQHLPKLRSSALLGAGPETVLPKHLIRNMASPHAHPSAACRWLLQFFSE